MAISQGGYPSTYKPNPALYEADFDKHYRALRANRPDLYDKAIVAIDAVRMNLNLSVHSTACMEKVMISLLCEALELER